MSICSKREKQMVFNRHKLITVTAISIILLSIAAWSSATTRLHLEVVECDSQTVILRLKVKPGSNFSVWFFHSYDRAYFEEHYRILNEGRIILTHMTFKSSLNGQGFEMGTYHSKPDGSAELSDINQEIKQVVFRLGSPDLANHALLIHGQRLRLLDYADAGDLLCIRTQQE